VFEWHESESLLENASQRKAIGKCLSTLRSVNTNQILLTNKVWISGYIVSSIFDNVINQRLFCTKKLT
jgi:hypothetical protein